MNKPPKRKYAGRYDPLFKIAIAREYLSTDKGYKTLAVKYDVPATSVHDFIVWYKKRYPNGVVDNLEETPKPNKLDEATLKIIALEMLIEKASKELGIDLVKKFGTKQQKG